MKCLGAFPFISHLCLSPCGKLFSQNNICTWSSMLLQALLSLQYFSAVTGAERIGLSFAAPVWRVSREGIHMAQPGSCAHPLGQIHRGESGMRFWDWLNEGHALSHKSRGFCYVVIISDMATWQTNTGGILICVYHNNRANSIIWLLLSTSL